MSRTNERRWELLSELSVGDAEEPRMEELGAESSMGNAIVRE